MAKTLELITIKEVCKILEISRNTFYKVLKDRVIQIPSLTKESQFDKESVLNEYARYKNELNNKID